MIAVVIPAHNEAELVGACLASVQAAALAPGLRGEQVIVVVIADSCSDGTACIAASAGAIAIAVSFQNVGQARAVGAARALDAGARWLAFTDADTVVAPDWLAAQLRLRADAVCGTVAVEDWHDYGERMRSHYARIYEDRDGHRHIHGANLGVCAQAYRRAGGFPPLQSSEDVALVNALIASGANVAWSAAPRVVTSARRNFRAPHGFGATLLRVDELAAASRGTAEPC
jgi:glycosyltransferase involved in cell wall biosynthesis